MIKDHSCVNDSLNPVLTEAQSASINTEKLGTALAQYCFLVRRIVAFLSIGLVRFMDSPGMKDELYRNVSEELGSRTEGDSHWVILFRQLQSELGLNVHTELIQQPPTQEFLELVEEDIKERSQAEVAGMLYALEASAVPELKIVAQLINHYAERTGATQPIDMAQLSNEQYHALPGQYNLESFFALHTVDFEQGHRSGLEAAVETLHLTAAETVEFEQGFHRLLGYMDTWWTRLAK